MRSVNTAMAGLHMPQLPPTNDDPCNTSLGMLSRCGSGHTAWLRAMLLAENCCFGGARTSGCSGDRDGAV
jgi:hypothetical protein